MGQFSSNMLSVHQNSVHFHLHPDNSPCLTKTFMKNQKINVDGFNVYFMKQILIHFGHGGDISYTNGLSILLV